MANNTVAKFAETISTQSYNSTQSFYLKTEIVKVIYDYQQATHYSLINQIEKHNLNNDNTGFKYLKKLLYKLTDSNIKNN